MGKKIPLITGVISGKPFEQLINSPYGNTFFTLLAIMIADMHGFEIAYFIAPLG